MTTIAKASSGREAMKFADRDIVHKFARAVASALGAETRGENIRTDRFVFEVVSRYKLGIVFVLVGGLDDDGEHIYMPNVRQPKRRLKSGGERIDYAVESLENHKPAMFSVPFGTHAVVAADRIHREWLPALEAMYGQRATSVSAVRAAEKADTARMTAFVTALGLVPTGETVFKFPGVDGFHAEINNSRSIELSASFDVDKLTAATPAIGALLEALSTAGDTDGQV